MGIAVVAGASRGIGLELARQIQARGANVVAVCRRSSPEFDALGVCVEGGIDVTVPAWTEFALRLAHDDTDLLISHFKRPGHWDAAISGADTSLDWHVARRLWP